MAQRIRLTGTLSVPILLSLFTGLKTLSIKSVIWHLLIDSERGLYMNMHRNLWQAGALVAPQKLCLSVLMPLCSSLPQGLWAWLCNWLWSTDISKCDTVGFVEGLLIQVVLLENSILEPRYHSVRKSRLYC